MCCCSLDSPTSCTAVCCQLRMMCYAPPFQNGYEGRNLLENICSGNYRKNTHCFPLLSIELQHLLWRMFNPDPIKRISLSEILEHEWIKGNSSNNTDYITAVRELYLLPQVKNLLRLRSDESSPPPIEKARSSSTIDSVQPESLHRMDSILESECLKCFEDLRKGEKGIRKEQLKKLIFGEGEVCATTQRTLDRVFNLMSNGSDGDGLVEFEQFKLFYKTASPAERTSFSIMLSIDYLQQDVNSDDWQTIDNFGRPSPEVQPANHGSDGDDDNPWKRPRVK